MVECWLPYGNTEVHVSVPIRNLLGIVEVEVEAVKEPEKEIIQAIQNPQSTNTLTNMVRRGEKIAVALEGDLPSPHIGFIVELIIKELLEAKINPKDISIIVSPGSFGSIRKDLRDQLTILDKTGIKFIQHSWTKKDTISVGEEKEVTIHINKGFMEADIRVLIGEVKPDLLTGYSGGPSILFPCLSDKKSIETVLKEYSDVDSWFSVLEGNPVYETSRKLTQLLNIDFSVNMVSDTKNNLTHIIVGELEDSWNKAVKLVEEIFKVKLERGDIFLISAGGYPYDRTLYNASKAIETISKYLGKNTKIILLAECSEGIGDSSFTKYLTEYNDVRNMRRQLKRKWELGGEMAYRMRNTLSDHQFTLVSILPDNLAKPLNINVRRTATNALNHVNRLSRKDSKVVVIPFGALTIPVS